MRAFRVPGAFILRSIFARGTGETYGFEIMFRKRKKPPHISMWGLFVAKIN